MPNSYLLYTLLGVVKIMGQRITQVIYECDDCGRTPENGEDVWEMYNGNGKEIICEKCIDKY